MAKLMNRQLVNRYLRLSPIQENQNADDNQSIKEDGTTVTAPSLSVELGRMRLLLVRSFRAPDRLFFCAPGRLLFNVRISCFPTTLTCLASAIFAAYLRSFSSCLLKDVERH